MTAHNYIITAGRPSRAAPAAATLVLLLAIPLASGCSSQAEAAMQDSTEAAVAVQVRAVAVIERPASVSASGTVDAGTTSDFGFKVGGRVARVLVEEGESVRAGQLLAVLDPTDYRLSVEQADANAQRAADEHARMRALHEAGSLAPNDYAKYATAARVAAAQAALAREQLAETRLVAPIAGVVARRGLDAGETAAPGAPAFSVVALDRMTIRIGVPESQIGLVRPGAGATISVPALAATPFAARVASVGVAADAASRTYPVKIDVANPEHLLLPGMIAEAQVDGSRLVRAITVPGEAVVHDAEGATLVFVYLPAEGRVYGRRVQLGSPVDRELQVTDGLRPGELVVVAGQTRVRDGMRVTTSTQTPTTNTPREAGR